MSTIEQAMALADAGFNVRVSAAGIEVLTNEEVAKIIEQGDE